MVGVVTALGVILQDLGLGVSALKSPTLTNQQASNLFWLNTLLGLISTSLVAGSGSLLAHIYDEPKLANITPFLALSIFFGGLQAQLQVQLSRAQKFGALAIIAATTSALGLAAAVIGASLGYGYWSLVAQTLTTSIMGFLLKGYATRWLPMRPRRRSETRELAVSGVDLTASSLVQYFSNNAATFMIGVRVGPGDVGLYGRAYQLVQLPMQFVSPLLNVAVPTLIQAKKRGEDTKHQLLRIQSIVATWVTLVLVVVSSMAPTLFRVVLGPQWEPAASIFQILAVGGVALGLSQVSYWAFLIEGKSRELLKYNLISKPMTTVFIVAGAFISVEATAAALSFALALSWMLNVWWLQRTAGIHARPFLVNGLRISVAGFIAVLASMLCANLWPAITLAQLTVPALCSGTVFLVLLFTSQKGRHELKEAVSIVGQLRR